MVFFVSRLGRSGIGGLRFRGAGAWLFAAMLLVALAAPWPASAADDEERVRASLEDGFGRIILRFDRETEVDVRTSATSSVVVVSYPDPVAFDVSKVAALLPGYVTAARKDPDEKGVRFALAGPYSINTIEAADRLIIDLLPESWQGLPPGLPDFIIEELRRRATEAEQARLRRERTRRIERAGSIDVRVGTLPTFTRISFHWPEPVAAKLTREDDTVTVVFEESAKLDEGRIRARLPAWVEDFRIGADERGGLRVSMTIDRDANVRGFPEGAAYMVDVTNPEQAEDVTPLSTPGRATSEGGAVSVDVAAPAPVTPPAAAPPVRSDQTSLPVDAAGPVLPSTPDQEPGEEAEATGEGRAQDGGQDWGQETGTAAEPAMATAAGEQNDSETGIAATPDRAPEIGQETAPPVSAAEQEDADTAPPRSAAMSQDVAVASAQGEDPPATHAADTGAASATPEEASATAPRPGTFTADDMTGEDAAAQAEPLPKRADLRDAIEVKVQQFGADKRLVFPFEDRTAGAFFLRNRVLWLVFDTDEPIVADAIMRDIGRDLVDVQSDYQHGKRVLRIRFLRPHLVSATVDENDWFVSLSDTIAHPPRPMVIDRRTSEDGKPEAIVPFEAAGRAVQMTDPDGGETFWVVSGFGPGAALIKPQRFVEFEGAATAHGVVVRPIADDVSLRVEDGLVVISTPSGLFLSGEVNRSFEAASGALGEIARPGFIGVETDKMRDERGIGSVIQQQMAAVSALPESERSAGRLRLAKLYLSADLAAEALGMLRYAAAENPAIEREPSFRALYGVAKVQMGRHGEALQPFDSFKLGQSPDVALWRGLAYSGLGQWRDAEVAFLEGEAAIESYSPDRQLRLRLAGARAALYTGDLKAATQFVAQAEAIAGSFDADPELLLLWGMLADRLGRSEQAIGAYETLTGIDDRKVQSEALLHKTRLQLSLGQIDAEEAIETYEALALTWRGDDVELKTLRALSEVYAGQHEYRRAFQLMKHAAISDTGSPITREIEDRMNALFIELFIGGRADALPPVEALALFYDFREMTPVGRQGDEMIRALADKLLEVDLLDQAANLLEHQVDHRLSGAARAQIATKLALIHLMNRKPEQALNVLARSRQAMLPESVTRQRIILEARALAETGRSDLAVDLLSAVEGDDIQRLAADALWRGEKWQDAAETLEKLLSGTWQPGASLTDLQTYDVMRMAIGYALAGDDLGSDRVQAKFSSVMTDTEDAVAFSIVTTPAMRNSGDFREVVRSVAAIDTLESFLANYRARFSTGGTEADS